MDYKTIKRKVPDFFCIQNLREIYKSGDYKFKISFVDFLMCIEDFYTFVYSTKVSRTSWMLFTWLKTLARYDGYVTLSYKDVSKKFCSDKGVISKPTFFKCIEELDSFGLVKKMNNKKLFVGSYQNDTNTYIVISKVNDVLCLLEQLDNQQEFYDLLKQNFFNIPLEKDNKQKNKRVQVSENKKEYTIEYVMDKYKRARHELNDFFVFLGSSNKSGKIAKSRQQKILNTIMDFKPHYKDLIYAISQTIFKGVKNEKYMYAILRNLYSDTNIEDENINETDEQLKDKYSYKNIYRHISDEDYERYKNILFENTEDGYEEVMAYINNLSKMDYLEEKLYKVCMLIRKKRRWLWSPEVYKILAAREKFLRKYGFSEQQHYAPNGDQLISWIYYKNNQFIDKPVPYAEIKKLFKKKPELFKYAKIQHLNGDIYNEE